MSNAVEYFVGEDSGEKPETILVVDDSASQRRILRLMLARLNYNILEAATGEEAIAICQKQDIGIILSDWMMPGMSGLEFCQEVRSAKDRPYSYFILLTSKSEKPEIARGLDVGADDFVSKPVSSSELLARIRAGERILHMERELREKNRMVSETLDTIRVLYDALDRDLVEARNLQQSLIPERHKEFSNSSVSLVLRSSGHVGGDLVGFIPVSDHQLGLFAVDVSGHGVASALLTARLAGLLLSTDVDQNVTLERAEDGVARMMSPAKAASDLNRVFFQDIVVEQYFTMVLARIDLRDGTMDFVQCGHPNPVVLNAKGHSRRIGGGGLPIGLIDDANWQEETIKLSPGDRLLLASDGMTETENRDGNMLGDEGLMRLFERNKDAIGPDLLEALIWDIGEFAGNAEFADDVSGVLFAFNP